MSRASYSERERSLPKLPAAPAPGDGRLLWKWGKFLAARTREELEQLAMNDPVFEEAKRALEELSADPAAQELAQEREIWAWNHEMQLRYARSEGERNVLRKQLVLKFGELPAEVIVRIDNAAEAELTRWTERILTANTLNQVFESSRE